VTSPAEHAEVVLSAILPQRPDLLEVLLERLTPDHFTEPTHAFMFKLLLWYSNQTAGGVLSRRGLEDILEQRKVDAGRQANFLEMYDLLAGNSVPDVEFTWSISQLRSIRAERLTKEAIANGLEVLRKGPSDEDDEEEIKAGHEAARKLVIEAFTEIDAELNQQDAPGGDLKEEKDDLVGDYFERKKAREAGLTTGIQFGIKAVDDVLGGLQPGDLCFTVGYSSDGKTSVCTQLAWNAMVTQGKNVVFLTTETSRTVVRRKLLARHSKLERFELTDGLNTRDLKNGTLTENEEAALPRIATDFARNPDYGHLWIQQVPNNATMASIEAFLYRIQRLWNIDLVIFDYLALLDSGKRRNSDREELSGNIKLAKRLGTTFDNGRGVPFVSPWQVNRMARDNAAKVGYYTSAALAETAEATNSADVILSLLAEESERENRHRTVKFQILKNRDGATANHIDVLADYATSAFQSKNSGNVFGRESQTKAYSQPSGFASLLN
jgi:replicative DNA helicase